MNRHPAEAPQDGRTEFWENIRDERLDRYRETLEGMRPWRPIDALMRRKDLNAIARLIVRATVIIKESRALDDEINEFHKQQVAIQPTATPLELIPQPEYIAHEQQEALISDVAI